MLATLGMENFARSHGSTPRQVGVYAAGPAAPGSPPPPPPAGSPGASRPRRKTSILGQQKPSSQEGELQDLAGVPVLDDLAKKRSKARKQRPGAGRKRRPNAFTSGQEVKALVLRQNNQPGPGQDLAGRPDAAELAQVQLDVKYIPPQILEKVRMIQYYWRKRVLRNEIYRRKAATTMQKHFRGYITRKHLKQEADEKARGRAVDGLWWINAHSHKTMYEPPTAGKDGKDKLAGLVAGLTGAGGDDGYNVNKWIKGAQGNAAQGISKAAEQSQAENKEKRKRRNQLARQRRKEALLRKKRGWGLPRWVIYVGYLLAMAYCAYASMIIITYGIIFEPAISRAWLLSSIFSLILEVFIQDPANIAIMGVVQHRIMEEIEVMQAKSNISHNRLAYKAAAEEKKKLDKEEEMNKAKDLKKSAMRHVSKVGA